MHVVGEDRLVEAVSAAASAATEPRTASAKLIMA